ncbi:CD109 antigen [Cloeon dipterum]|uniref:CD109 antigen n=1 Tax=Cloeon dipterum TaxID=197152 RepID=UPI0032208FF6
MNLVIAPLAILLLISSPAVAQRQNQRQESQRESTDTSIYNKEDVSRNNIDSNNLHIEDASYFIVASRVVRPGHLYRLAVTILRSALPVTVKATIQRNGVEVAAARQIAAIGVTESLALRVPPTSVKGHYRLRVEGILDDMLGGIFFRNDTALEFSPRSMTIFIQTDKPVYIQGQTVRFRVAPITTELKGFNDAVDVFMLDPHRTIMKRWLSRQSNLGTVSLEYQLSDQPIFGDWIIRAEAQGMIEEASFTVNEYYQTRFEVNVTMPAFFLESDGYIYGSVMANYTSGAPVYGNLTLKATITPILRNGIGKQQEFNTTRNTPGYRVFREEQPVEKFFTFKEDFPFWYDTPAFIDDEREVPQLKHFYGIHNFRYPMADLHRFVSSLSGMEIRITASVGERFLDEIVTGYSTARIYNSTLKVTFLGGSPQVFRPSMPFHCYVAVSYHDNTPLDLERLKKSKMEISAEVVMRTGGRRSLETQLVKMSSEKPGIFSLKIDLRSQLGGDDANERRLREMLNDVASLKLTANFKDSKDGFRTTAELTAVSHWSPNNQHLKVFTSTKNAKVGEYLILHVQSNAILDSFSYVVIAKGVVLYASQEKMLSTVHTLALTISPEMAPSATVLVYHPASRGVALADSLTFPVDGISRNNFTVFVNNRKARTGQVVEIAIYGEPGSYVGLAAMDRAFYAMQSPNQISFTKSLQQMSLFDLEMEGTSPLLHAWVSHEGNPDELHHFPSSSRGIDANATFETSGLIVFSDRDLPLRPSICNATQGYLPCLTGQGGRSGGCFKVTQKCDGRSDCSDGTDESYCPKLVASAAEDLRKFRATRFSMTQKQMDNVWLWTDVNIGPHGRELFNIPVPSVPAHWMVSAFSVSPTVGYGVLNKAVEYFGVVPFSMIVEMPKQCRQGEQVGVRVVVFNYQHVDIEATVVLNSSPDYKFVHVEANGIVNSYSPRTSHGEHQFFVFIRAHDAAIVMVPIVPTRLGDIEVSIYTTTLMGMDKVTRSIHVEADGLPQYRHHSILLDLRNRAYVVQYLHVNVTETPIIPYEESRYYVFGSNKASVSVVGDVMGAIFPTMPMNATSVLNLPLDSAEQSMFGLAAHVYTTYYMRFINQRNKTIEKQSFHHLNVGYQRMLSFRNQDGSFSLFRSDWNHSSPSVWVTAYCAKIFQELSFNEWENFIFIDPTVIDGAVRYVLNHQTVEGSFWEVTWLPDRKVNASLQWPNDEIGQRNITLTAHVLIMLEKVKSQTGGLGALASLAQRNAVQWLERNLKLLKDHGKPYEVAVVTYALLVSKSSQSEAAFQILNSHARHEGGLLYWGREVVPQPPFKMENQKPFLLPRLPYKYDSENIETTAWALMTYVARQELLVDPIVKWLNSQRLFDGGWASTQDTAVAMEALIAYADSSRLRDVSTLTVTVEATSLPGKTKVLQVRTNNIADLQKIDIPEAWGTVKIQAKGAGYAILQMSVQYNVDMERFQTAPPVPAFDLTTKVQFHGRNQSHITYRCCQRWTLTDESPRSGLAVLEVAVPTGYIVQQQNLDAYVQWLSYEARKDYVHSNLRPIGRGHQPKELQSHRLQRARFTDTKVYFYFNYLDNDYTCINFTLERWFPVANMSRYLPIRVYDYYAPERFNETIFDALSTYVLNICEVCASSQCPYCPIYNAAVHVATSLPFVALISLCMLLIWNTRDPL